MGIFNNIVERGEIALEDIAETVQESSEESYEENEGAEGTAGCFVDVIALESEVYPSAVDIDCFDFVE